MFLRACVFLWLFVNPWLWWGKQNAKRKIFSSTAVCPFQIWPKRNKHLSINDGCVKIFVISEVGGRGGIFIPRQTISNNSLWVEVKWSKVMVLGNYLQVSRPPVFFLLWTRHTEISNKPFQKMKLLAMYSKSLEI